MNVEPFPRTLSTDNFIPINPHSAREIASPGVLYMNPSDRGAATRAA
ncbi:MAG: hypothetical protein V3T24_11270 [Longimicrobiales bacterium]